jgi:hypothetical protein
LQGCKTTINDQLGEVDKEGCEMDSEPFFVWILIKKPFFDAKTSKKGIYTEGVKSKNA